MRAGLRGARASTPPAPTRFAAPCSAGHDDAVYDYYYRQQGCNPTKDIGTLELHIPPERHTPPPDVTSMPSRKSD
ncbi:MAG TPA: hypothetical protein VN541_22605 [Tepidisphaeraceae bacterium]|nr:hypothetical protein [Tepidisphaeraceae bacterium]